MNPFTFITGNKNKIEQLERFLGLPFAHQNLDVPELQSLDLVEVATAKARSAYAVLRLPVLVEDTSLRFNALNGLPGPLVKWFLTSVGNVGLIKVLDGYADRSAVAHTCFVLCEGDSVHVFEHEQHGTIAHEPAGTAVHGWDAIFVPRGYSKTWGEMTREERIPTNLRSPAVRALKMHLGNR